jgi:hypothetical protein
LRNMIDKPKVNLIFGALIVNHCKKPNDDKFAVAFSEPNSI